MWKKRNMGRGVEFYEVMGVNLYPSPRLYTYGRNYYVGVALLQKYLW